MAECTLEFTLTWENNVDFTMKAKKNGGDNVTIIKLEEDGNIANLWGDVSSICKRYFESQMKQIGVEMKS